MIFEILTSINEIFVQLWILKLLQKKLCFWNFEIILEFFSKMFSDITKYFYVLNIIFQSAGFPK